LVIGRYFTAEEIAQDEETIKIAEERAVEPRVYIDGIDDDGEEEEDDIEPEYDPSDDGDFDQALHGDLDIADENME
jgi:hypothetical protein